MLKRVLHQFTSASTGTPSDGLGGGGEGSESSASVIASYHAAARQQNSEKNGGDWELEEIIVDNEEGGADHESQHRPHLTANTGSEKGTLSQNGSLRRNFDRQNSGHSDSGYSSWVRGHLWPYVVTFFNPHFEEPGAHRFSSYVVEKLIVCQSPRTRLPKAGMGVSTCLSCHRASAETLLQYTNKRLALCVPIISPVVDKH